MVRVWACLFRERVNASFCRSQSHASVPVFSCVQENLIIPFLPYSLNKQTKNLWCLASCPALRWHSWRNPVPTLKSGRSPYAPAIKDELSLLSLISESPSWQARELQSKEEKNRENFVEMDSFVCYLQIKPTTIGGSWRFTNWALQSTLSKFALVQLGRTRWQVLWMYFSS